MEPRFLLMSLLLLLLVPHTSVQRVQLLLLLHLVLLLPTLLPPLLLPHSNILDLLTWKQDLLIILMELRFLLMSLLLLLLVPHISRQRLQFLLLLVTKNFTKPQFIPLEVFFLLLLLMDLLFILDMLIS